MESPAVLLSDGPKLRRELSLVNGLSILVGIIVGSGIFTTPGVVFAQAGSVGEGLIVWIIAGAVALCLAFLYAELGSSIPVASGEAEFYKIAFGPSWSFAFVWTSFFVLTAGSINIIASALAAYFVAAIFSADVTGQDLNGDERVKYVAIACVVVLSICNCAGVRVGSILQNLLSICKAMLVALLAVLAVVRLSTDMTILQSNFDKPFIGSSFSGFGPSMVAAMWAFCGLGNIGFLSEELKNPRRDIPRASFGGIVIVTSIYLVVNFSYLAVLPLSDIKASIIVAMDTTKAVLGHRAGSITAILVAISMLGSVNAVILCGARYLFSSARDGLIYRRLGQLGHRTSAPTAALVAQAPVLAKYRRLWQHFLDHQIMLQEQGVWSVLLLLQSSNVVKILNYFSIASYFFTLLTALAHWKLRYQFPDLQRPFKVPFHPTANILVIFSGLYMIVTSILADPLPTILSLSFVLLAFPAFFVFKRGEDSDISSDNEQTALLN